MQHIELLNAIFVFYLIYEASGLGVSWDWAKWWTYDGISGPQFWGLINPEWSLCTHGRRQSPINIDPLMLLYDPNLRALRMDKHRVSGRLNNTGHSVVFSVDEDPFQEENPSDVGNILGSSSFKRRHKNLAVNITGGPLSYRYVVTQVQLHFGSHDKLGSEHQINDTTYPAEIQILGYNSELFRNFSEASSKSNGLIGLSVVIQVGTSNVNQELRQLTDATEHIRFSGTSYPVRQLSIRGLLPDTKSYVTYEGSLTQPPCHETVTWILLNKPVYITKQQLHSLRKLHQGTARVPKAKMVNNYRPIQTLHHRPVRTNIDFNPTLTKKCPTMAKNMFYKANVPQR